MRFAYIDSQGQEVPISGVDALALRIELGAIRAETQLYDAQADYWGPAHTHEIFHSLSRDAGGGGFVAPPPPLAQPTGPSDGVPAQAPDAQAADATLEPEPEPDRPEATPAGAIDFGLTLAEPPPPPLEETEELGSWDLTLDAAPSPEGRVELSGESAEEKEEEEEEEGEGKEGFDFGEMALEDPMDFASSEGALVAEEDVHLGPPAAPFEPASPPGWTEQPESEEVMDFSTVGSEEAAEEGRAVPVSELTARQRRVPKSLPSPPRFKQQRSTAGVIVFVVLLLALGIGGYVAWPIFRDSAARDDAPAVPAVVLPDIPPELIPRVRSLGEAAIADFVAAVDAATRDPEAPSEPHQDWLAGIYLGNASQYPGVAAFWEGIGAFTEGLRAADGQGYVDRYEEQLSGSGLAEDAQEQVAERGEAGFRAAQPQRMAAYSELQRLVDAALDLHEFLVANEADIVFRPGVTSASDPRVDPVLEIAAPDDDRERMLSMFDEITEALDALGSLDRVTRERLVAAMTARLQQVGLL